MSPSAASRAAAVPAAFLRLAAASCARACCAARNARCEEADGSGGERVFGSRVPGGGRCGEGACSALPRRRCGRADAAQCVRGWENCREKQLPRQQGVCEGKQGEMIKERIRGEGDSMLRGAREGGLHRSSAANFIQLSEGSKARASTALPLQHVACVTSYLSSPTNRSDV